MTLFRSFVYFFVFLITVVIYTIPLLIIGFAVPFIWRARYIRSWGQVNLWLLRIICNLDYRITGIENLNISSCIVMSNHQSTWETIALRAILPPKHTWVLKHELLFVPFYGWALRYFKPIAINRKAGRSAIRQLLTEGIAALSDGLSIVIFPEGTRVNPGERVRYAVGGAMLAERTGVPIIPIAHNAGVFWRRRDIRKYPGIIDIVIGTPIDSRGLSAVELNKIVESWINQQIHQLQQLNTR